MRRVLLFLYSFAEEVGACSIACSMPACPPASPTLVSYPGVLPHCTGYIKCQIAPSLHHRTITRGSASASMRLGSIPLCQSIFVLDFLTARDCTLHVQPRPCCNCPFLVFPYSFHPYLISVRAGSAPSSPFLLLLGGHQSQSWWCSGR